MNTVYVDNVSDALHRCIEYFMELEHDAANIVAPRGQRTVEAPSPVATVYRRSMDRVLFSPVRDANPFFHLFEGLWMLAGRRDLAFVEKLVKRMGTYSDDGVTLRGAYGYRWRSYFGYDQLAKVVALLREHHDTRRAVLAIWDPLEDLRADSSDVPCNTHVYFKVRRGRLHMTVCCRSNDALWGAYGANAVHMSMLHEYIAAKLGVLIGIYTQVSDSLHIYLDGDGGKLWARLKQAKGPHSCSRYARSHPEPVQAYPMGCADKGWDVDLAVFMDATTTSTHLEVERRLFVTDYFKHVVTPMWRGWTRRDRRELLACVAPDWRVAGMEWLERHPTQHKEAP